MNWQQVHGGIIQLPGIAAIEQKTGPMAPYSSDGGEGGIRTLEELPLTHFPGVLLRPLGHLSGNLVGCTATA